MAENILNERWWDAPRRQLRSEPRVVLDIVRPTRHCELCGQAIPARKRVGARFCCDLHREYAWRQRQGLGPRTPAHSGA